MSGTTQAPLSKAAKKKGALGQYTASNKTGIIIIGALGCAVVGAWFFMDRSGDTPASSVSIDHHASNVIGTKGTAEYNRQEQSFSARQSQAALKTGQSYVGPLALGANQGENLGISTPSTSNSSSAQKQAQAAAAQQSASLQSGTSQGANQAQQALLEAYTRQIQGLMGANSNLPAPTTIQVENQVASSSTNAGSSAPSASASSLSASSTTKSASIGDLGLAPGDVLYAVFDIAADSDEPGPVMARVVTGPLTGARLIGAFTREKGELVVQFSTLSFANQTYGLTSYAIDPTTSLPAVRSSVNNHYLSSFGDLLAGAFLGAAAGYGQAVAQAGQQSVQTSGFTSTITTPILTPAQEGAVAGAQAAGTVAQVVGSSLMNNYNQPPTVRIAAGKDVAVLIESAQAPSNLPSTAASQAVSSATNGAASQQGQQLIPPSVQVGRGFNSMSGAFGSSLSGNYVP